MIPLITLSFVLGLATVLVILWPLLELKAVSEKPRDLLRELERLLFERERYLNNLKDLELDRGMKKISDTDYSDLRQQILGEASSVYAALEELEKKSPAFQKIEADLLKAEKEFPI